MRKLIGYFLFIPLVAAIFACIAPAASERINPARVLVTTVIDVSNKEIVRDSLTLFRSIRLFGDTFNNATFLAYITLEDTYVDTRNLLENLASLRVQWDFIKPVESHVPKTMNKLLTFHKFDALKYDYLLWLDADVVLFRDPMPYLYAHQYPGQIQCTPDMYNYLKRFPHVNGSNVVWNAAMSEYQLDGQNEYAPHGLCNTGVILFDKLSLATFMGALNETTEYIRSLNPYSKDRFLDSLIFVAIVNRYNIDVIIRGYELNYMSFFEIEIQESSETGDLIFAHLITDTDLYCSKNNDETCVCVYHNTNLKDVSLIYNAMGDRQFSHQHICEVLAGEMTMRDYEGLGYNTSHSYRDVDYQVHSFVQPVVPVLIAPSVVSLSVTWPPAGGMIFHDLDQVRLPVQLQWTGCSEGTLDTGRIDVLIEVTNVYSGGTLCSKRLVLNICEALVVLDWLVFTIQKLGNLDSKVDNNFHKNGESLVTLKISAASSGIVVSDLNSMNITLFQYSLAYPGLARYADNILLGRRPLQFDTQLKIPQYLAMWGHTAGRYGAAVCCNSASGVAVVENLIERWTGAVLVIYMRALPNAIPPNCPATNNSAVVMQDWINYFNEMCHSAHHGLRCAIFDLSEINGTGKKYAYNIGKYSLSPYALRFVYMDVYEGYHEYKSSILRWLDILPKGSILFGSDYSNTVDEVCLMASVQSPCLSGPRAAVDAAAYETRRVVLTTNAEGSNGAEWSGANKYCRAFRSIQHAQRLGATCSDFKQVPDAYSETCAGDASWYCASPSYRHEAGAPKGSECFLKVTERDCAPSWFFHMISKPLPL